VKFGGTVKIRGRDFFPRCKSREGDTVLVTVEHYNCPVEEAHTGFAYINAPVIRNQGGDRIQNFKALDLLRDC